MDYDFEKKFEEARARKVKYGLLWTDAKAEATRLKKYESSLVSNLILSTEGKSIAERERKALASKEYTTHIEGLVESERKTNRLWVAVEDAQAEFEQWKSLCSQQTAMIRLH